MVIGAFAFLVGPLAVLVLAGTVAARDRGRTVWPAVVGLALTATLVWLVYVGLYQHQTPCSGRSSGCPTVYGYHAPLPDEHFAGQLLLLVGFVAPAAWVGWRRRVPPLSIGASLAIGPTLLAWWTAPRGDNDGLWTLVFLFLPVLGGIAAAVAAVAGRIHASRESSSSGDRAGTTASAGDRVSAVGIDALIVAVLLVAPLTALSHAHHEVVAAVLGIGLATGYLGLALAWKGRTPGQSLVGLAVVSARDSRRIGLMQALLRSLVVVLEVAAIPTVILALPAAAELLSLNASGRSITDRILGTSVVSGAS